MASVTVGIPVEDAPGLLTKLTKVRICQEGSGVNHLLIDSEYVLFNWSERDGANFVESLRGHLRGQTPIDGPQ